MHRALAKRPAATPGSPAQQALSSADAPCSPRSLGRTYGDAARVRAHAANAERSAVEHAPEKGDAPSAHRATTTSACTTRKLLDCHETANPKVRPSGAGFVVESLPRES